MRSSRTALRALFIVLIACISIFLFLTQGRTANSPLIISEFRLRGPGGSGDEFIEIYNNTDSPHTVAATDGSAGYGVFASDGVMRFFIPNGTVIPARGHFLGANISGYTLFNYPAGNSTTATADATWTTNIPDNAGVALFTSTNTPALGNRLDAVGSTTVANTLYREGAGYPALVAFSIEYSFVRRVPILGGNAGLPEDTDNNASDFIFVDANGTSAGAGQRLGAPGPENLGGARDAGNNINHSRVDPAQADNASPNVGRDFASDPANNATFGTLSIRRKFTNNTGAPLTALRFRIINVSTFPAPAGFADLRPRSSLAIGVPLTGGGTAVAEGVDLDQPPNQVHGGGFNSSMRAGLVTSMSPLPAGASVNLNFLIGIQQTGCYQLALVAEALPAGGGDVFLISGNTEGGSGSCAAPTPTPTPTPPPVPGGTSLIISEFRLRGPNGSNDEFIEIYNNSDNAVNVAALDGSAGYGVAASDGITRFVIPNGTIIPARGHYLGVNSSGYSLGSYPAGSGMTAGGNATYSLNIADNAGIALFKTSNAAQYNFANRLDAVGATSEGNFLYKEGAGYPAIVAFSINASFHRKIPPVGGGAGKPQDTNNNPNDFLFVDTNGTSAGAGQRLGAPGPENLSGPRTLGTEIDHAVIDPAQADTASPNVSRDFASDPANNATFGRISFRRKFTNNTGGNITQLRFRVIDLTTFPAPGGTSDLRPQTSGNIVVPLTGGGSANVVGTTLEQPPSQVHGGGFNSSMSVSSITTAAPLLAGASIDVQFQMGIQQTGCYVFAVVAETLPAGGSEVFLIAGSTEGGSASCAAPTPTPTPTPTPPPGGTTLIISEFRLRGPNGANDEFVEIYNNSNNGVNVQASDGSNGYAVVASDGITRFFIPNGTIIPARGHFLGVNTGGYSLSGYPAGPGANAVGNATYTTDIADNVGIALFRTTNPANFNLANRLDAVGSTAEGNALFKEGAGLPALVAFSINCSWYRNIPSVFGGAGVPQDTGNNSADFKFVDTNGTSAGGGQRLGAPGPENLFSPGHLNTGPSVDVSLVDPAAAMGAAPNYVRSFASDPANNSTFGTIDVRRRFTNSTGVPINRLRVRIIDITTFPAPSGTADLRPRGSGSVVVSVSGGGTQTVQGTTLEQPPAQVHGGGFNSSMSASTVTLGTPLNSGGSINLRFLFGVQQQGSYQVCAVIETLPFTNSAVMCFIGNTGLPGLRSEIVFTSFTTMDSSLFNVGLTASTTDPAEIDVRVFADEDDETPTLATPLTVHSPDAKDIAPETLRLRAERTEAGDGRVYLIVVSATNENGTSRVCHTVVAPQKKRGDVDEQAAAAKAFCEANGGEPPRGYFVIGDGPIIGREQ